MIDIEHRLAAAYHQALSVQSNRQGRGPSPSIRIHVGPDVWMWLIDRLPDCFQPPLTVSGSTLWGFPVVLEGEWGSERIVVRADVQIP